MVRNLTFGALLTDDSIPNLASPKQNQYPDFKPKVAFGRGDVIYKSFAKLDPIQHKRSVS